MRKFIILCVLALVLSFPADAQETNPVDLSALNAKAMKLHGEGKSEQAIEVAKRAVTRAETQFGKVSRETAMALDTVFSLYLWTGKADAEKEKLLTRALAIISEIKGEEHPDFAYILGTKAQLYKHKKDKKTTEAYQRIIDIYENFGVAKLDQKELEDFASFLYTYANMLRISEKFNDAEPLYKRVVEIFEIGLGPEHFKVAISLKNLARFFDKQKRYAEAEPFYKRALAIFGKTHEGKAWIAVMLNNLALLYQKQGRNAEAEPLYKRALAVYNNDLDADSILVAITLQNLADFYRIHERYEDAEPLYVRALAIREKALGSDRLDVGSTLNNLAFVYIEQGRYVDAESLYKRALAINKKALGAEHPSVASVLDNLASLYALLARHAEAERLHKRALAIREKTLGPNHKDVSLVLNNLGLLYVYQGRYVDAEPLYKRALEIHEKTLGKEHTEVATTLDNLASLYMKLGRYADAEALHKRALLIREKALGTEHKSMATSLNNLGALYFEQERYAEAEPLYKRALTIIKKTVGDEHKNVASLQNNIAHLYFMQGRYAESEPLYKRALAIYEKTFGPEHPHIARTLNNLATLYDHQGRNAEAEALYKRALTINDKGLGTEHPSVATQLNNLGELYRKQGRYVEAESLHNRALEIRKKALGEEHTLVATTLNNLAALYTDQGRYTESEPLLRRSLKIDEIALGAEHTKISKTLNNLAFLYKEQGRYAEAEPLYKRALTIIKKTVGDEHKNVASLQNNIAHLYFMQGRYAESELLYKRALAIYKKALGPHHTSVANTLNNLVPLYLKMGRKDDAAALENRLADMPETGTRDVSLYFVTNRKRVDGTPKISFGGKRAGILSFGQARVQLPKEELDRLAGRRVQGLGRLHHADGKLTSANQLNIRKVVLLESDDALTKLATKKLKRASLYKNHVLVFVHGYNVGFDDAIRRAAQIAFDLEFDGVLIPFTWPSQKSFLGYATDRDSADIAVNHLVNLIDTIATGMPNTTIDFVAHSMGNLVVLGALEKIAIAIKRGAPLKTRFGEVILAHPDVDSERFSQLIESVKQLNVGLTLYANANDWALWVSKKLRGTGRAGAEALVIPGLDTIDTSGMGVALSAKSVWNGTWSLNHDVFVRNPILFGEMTRLLLSSKRPVHERTSEFEPVETEKGIYWKFKPPVRAVKK